MSKLAPSSIKYIIKAKIQADGVVEKPDVIGAIFGQTEGLLGPDLDLRELQRTGRIGRIEVDIKFDKGNSYGEILIPSSLDSPETALIAATLETIERIGPCSAKIKLTSVEDVRSMKRKFVVEKAKEILKSLFESGVPDTSEISEELREAVRADELTSYNGLPCGPNLLTSDSIIIVEGRADVINLLKHGIRNAIAIEGTSVPEAIIKLSKEKIATALVDDDRGGDLILKELLQVADIDYVARASNGKEVEELSKKEIFKALREKISAEQFKLEKGNFIEKKEEKPKKEKIKLLEEQKELFKKTLEELVGTRAAYIFNSNSEILGKVPIKELFNTIKRIEDPFAVVIDSKVTQKLESIARKRNIKFLVGMEKEKFDTPITVLSREDLE